MMHSLNSGLLLPASVHGVTVTVTVETTPASRRRQFIIPDLYDHHLHDTANLADAAPESPLPKYFIKLKCLYSIKLKCLNSLIKLNCTIKQC